MSILTVLLDRDLPKSPPQSARSVDEGEEVVGCLGGAQQVGEVTAAPSEGYNVLVSCKGEARAGEKEMVDSLVLFAASRAVGCRGALDAVEVLKERGVSSAQLDEGTELPAREACHPLEEGSPGQGGIGEGKVGLGRVAVIGQRDV